jgi:hypothetical protein
MTNHQLRRCDNCGGYLGDPPEPCIHPHNPGGAFHYKVGDHVTYSRTGKRVRIKARTIEPALGKTYLIQYQNGHTGGYVPERTLSREKS